MAPSTTTPASAAAVRALRTTLRGGVLAAGDAAYEPARRLWNGAVEARPAVIVRPADETDVTWAVRIARTHGLPLSVRGGGHDWAGRATVDGGLVIDLADLRRVTVDRASGTAVAQGGARAGDLVEATRAFGLAPVTGTVKAVGFAGLALGGGYGLLAGKCGLALDNLVSARVVLTDGRPVVASADENADLFWALRGGGGNFGVVTELRVRLHPIGTVLAGMILHPLARAASVLRGYRDIIATAADELTVMTGFFGGPDGQPLVYLLPVWCGDIAEGRRVIDRFDALGKPLAGRVCPQEYAAVLGMFDQVVVDGRHNEVATRWLPELTDEAVESIVDAAATATSPYSGMYVHHFHGAASRVPAGDTAFALRRDHLLVEIGAAWDPARPAAPHRRWAHQVSAAFAGHALPGGYPNLLGPEEHQRATAAFGPGAGRLLKVKERYDPDRLFSAVAALEPTDPNPGA
ncbi:FAD-binding oxidoreductase [Streptomyces sp. NPDC057257]|uniref:FAD-binding oxidoreductase n=1 Tax=Streptomyces sp. NPDC057257 TaxID=3346071 RepID=UPI00363962AF